MNGVSSAGSSASPPKLHQNPAETLHIRRLENGIERPGGRSRPAPRHFASLVVADAFAGALTRGSIRTFPATTETENTASYQGGARLGREDSNLRMAESKSAGWNFTKGARQKSTP